MQGAACLRHCLFAPDGLQICDFPSVGGRAKLTHLIVVGVCVCVLVLIGSATGCQRAQAGFRIDGEFEIVGDGLFFSPSLFAVFQHVAERLHPSM